MLIVQVYSRQQPDLDFKAKSVLQFTTSYYDSHDIWLICSPMVWHATFGTPAVAMIEMQNTIRSRRQLLSTGQSRNQNLLQKTMAISKDIKDRIGNAMFEGLNCHLCGKNGASVWSSKKIVWIAKYVG
ncbi:unnamed protein product [Absidia cylindrospora]